MGRFGIAGRIAAVVAAAAALAPAPAQAAVKDITVRTNVFDPAVTAAAGGDLLRWTVESGNHTITAYSGGTFNFSLVQPNDVKTFTFAGGTALYRCEFHSTIDPLSLDCQGMCGAVTDRTTAPAAATITTPAQNASIPSAIVRLEGTAQPQTHAVIREGGVDLGRALAGANGIWKIDLPFQRGTHTVVARATHVNGLTGPDSAPLTFTVTADTQAPTATVDGGDPQILLRRPSTIVGTATDDIALAWVEVRIAPLLALGPVGPLPGVQVEPTRIVRLAANGAFFRWSMRGELSVGAWQISARAIDLANNVGEFSPSVTVVYGRLQP